MNDAPKRRSRVQQEQPAERTGSRHRSRRSRGGRKNGKALYYAVLVILVGVLVFSSVKIISYLKEQKDTERINDNINQDFISPDDTAGDTDTDGDGTDGDSQETQKPVKKDEESIKVDFTAMQAKYPDVVGYVYSANTTLQLPIVQSADEGGGTICTAISTARTTRTAPSSWISAATLTSPLRTTSSTATI